MLFARRKSVEPRAFDHKRPPFAVIGPDGKTVKPQGIVTDSGRPFQIFFQITRERVIICSLPWRIHRLGISRRHQRCREPSFLAAAGQPDRQKRLAISRDQETLSDYWER